MKELIDKIIGEDREPDKNHNEGPFCICTYCNDCYGYNRRGKQIRERLEKELVEIISKLKNN